MNQTKAKKCLNQTKAKEMLNPDESKKKLNRTKQEMLRPEEKQERKRWKRIATGKDRKLTQKRLRQTTKTLAGIISKEE